MGSEDQRVAEKSMEGGAQMEQFGCRWMIWGGAANVFSDNACMVRTLQQEGI